eukprot:TCONS_00011524-protein
MVSLLFRFSSNLLKLEQDLRIRHHDDVILRKPSRDVTEDEIRSDEFQTLVDKMIKIMKENYGQGLAATQVGYNLKLIIVEFAEEDYKNSVEYYGQREVEKRDMRIFPLTVLVNPKMRVLDFDTTLFEEGCLSLPMTTGDVERFKKIEMEGLDRYGNPVKFVSSGWTARVFQHEMHHLKGLLIIDYFLHKSKNWLRNRLR